MTISRKLAFVLGVVLSGCEGAGSIAHRDTLRLMIQEDPRNLNPILAASGSEPALARLAFDSLLTFNERGGLVPDLATEVPNTRDGTISPDGLKYTFTLRRDVIWHDGHHFTSADVAFTMKTLQQSTHVASSMSVSDILSVRTPNAWTVIFQLRKRFSPFMAVLGAGQIIIPRHLVENAGDLAANTFNSKPIGTGPYRFQQWLHGSKISYVANDRYFLGPPRIHRLEIFIISDSNSQDNALLRHDIDFAGVQSAQFSLLKTQAGLRSSTEPMNDFVGIALNTTRPILADVRVRRAMAMALNRAELAKKNTAGTGVPAFADLPSSFWHPPWNQNPTPYNPVRAGKLLDAAGWLMGEGGLRKRNGTTLTLHAVAFSESVTGRNVDAQVQQMMRTIGVDVTYKYYPLRLYYAPASMGGTLAKGDFDIADFPYNAGGGDPENDQLYTCANREPRGFNAAQYCNQEMDDLQEQSLTELDPKKRAGFTRKIELLAARDVPYIFLYHTPKRLIWAPYLSRSRSSLTDYWYDVRNWHFESR